MALGITVGIYVRRACYGFAKIGFAYKRSRGVGAGDPGIARQEFKAGIGIAVAIDVSYRCS